MRTTQIVGGAHFLMRPLHNTALTALLSTFSPVIYKSKLPAPSVSMPCESCILQSPTKEQVKLVLLETARRSLYAKVLRLG